MFNLRRRRHEISGVFNSRRRSKPLECVFSFIRTDVWRWRLMMFPVVFCLLLFHIHFMPSIARLQWWWWCRKVLMWSQTQSVLGPHSQFRNDCALNKKNSLLTFLLCVVHIVIIPMTLDETRPDSQICFFFIRKSFMHGWIKVATHFPPSPLPHLLKLRKFIHLVFTFPLHNRFKQVYCVYLQSERVADINTAAS